MDWLNKIIGSGLSDVIDSIGKVIDLTITSEEEKLLLQKELKEIELNAKLKTVDQSIELEKQISARWVSDNQSDSWLAKNIRPLSLAWVLVSVTLIAVADSVSTSFKLDAAYIPLFSLMVGTILGGYFISRGAEKITRTIKGSDMDLF